MSLTTDACVPHPAYRTLHRAEDDRRDAAETSKTAGRLRAVPI
jgi:hypothetical protein